MTDTLFKRRDRLVEVFHTTTDDKARKRAFDLIVRINTRLLDKGRRETDRRLRAMASS